MRNLDNIVTFSLVIRESINESKKTGVQPVFKVSEKNLSDFIIACRAVSDEILKAQIIPIVITSDVTVRSGHLSLVMATLLAETHGKLTGESPLKILQRIQTSSLELLESLNDEEIGEYINKYGFSHVMEKNNAQD